MRLYLRPTERRPEPPPPVSDDRRVVLAGTVLWAALFVVAVLAHRTLSGSGRGWWVWTPAAGVALGLYGLRYVRRRSGGPGA